MIILCGLYVLPQIKVLVVCRVNDDYVGPWSIFQNHRFLLYSVSAASSLSPTRGQSTPQISQKNSPTITQMSDVPRIRRAKGVGMVSVNVIGCRKRLRYPARRSAGMSYGIGLASFHICAGEERGGDFELFGGSAG